MSWSPPQRTAAPRRSAAVQSCPPGKKKEKIKIRATLFFDGTGNNRVNTEAWNRWKSTPPAARGAEPGQGKDSYGGDFTNVSKLHQALSAHQPGYDKAIKIYVEGIGTINGGEDPLAGGAWGTDATGIPARVTKGLSQLYSGIALLVPDPESTSVEVHLDSFGFSRGAAAARHYIYRVLEHASDNLRRRLSARRIEVTDIKFRYCGLFDTVSSYEPNTKGLTNAANKVAPNFENDVAELRLTAIARAERTFQLAAADEHRENFSLTNVRSAGGKGRQIYCPGAHSDIGGGYRDNSSEVELKIYDLDVVLRGKGTNAAFERQKAWLVSRGWYTRAELSEARYANALYATRRPILNHYARIPLQIMGEDAKRLQLAFDPLLENGRIYAVPAALAGWHRTVKAIAAQEPNIYFQSSNPNLRALRHRYLHFSAYYPQYDSIAGAKKQGMWPRFVRDDATAGQRIRLVING